MATRSRRSGCRPTAGRRTRCTACSAPRVACSFLTTSTRTCATSSTGRRLASRRRPRRNRRRTRATSRGADLFAGLDVASRQLLVRTPQPEWIGPMLATLTRDYFSADGWMFERKLDGERLLSYCTGSTVRLLSRNQLRLDNTYPEIVDALQSGRTHDVVLDGEVVALENGQTSFSRLQQRFGINDAAVARRSLVAVTYFIFDV